MRDGRRADRRDRARTHIWELSAADLVAGYAGGQFTPRDALESVLTRIAAVNPRINAIVTLDVAGARATANASSVRWRRGAALGTFDGVPLTAQNNIPLRPLPPTRGSPTYPH